MKKSQRTISFLILSFFLLSGQYLVGQIAIVGKMKFDFTAKRGDRIKDAIRVYNSSDRDQTIDVYLSDYDGSAFYPLGSFKRSNAKWIKVRDPRVLVPAKSHHDVEFEIKVPKKLDRLGSFYSLIFIHEVKPKPRGERVAINVSKRYGVPIVVNVGSGAIDLRFKSIEYKSGSAIIEVLNSGSLVFDGTLTLQIGGGVFESDRRKFYPEMSRRFEFPLNLSDGVYKSRIFLEIIDGDTFAARHQFRIGDDSGLKKKSKS